MSDRKYSQKGYREDERGERGPAKRTGQAPAERPEGPRGRGLGKPTVTLFRCRDCGTRVPDPAAIANDTLCAKCRSPLHACVNCGFFDPSVHWECRQPITEPVRGKAKANACPLFAPKLVSEWESGKSDRETPDDAKAAFDKLFKF